MKADIPASSGDGIFVPNSLKDAACEIRIALACPLDQLPKSQFVRSWCAVSYLFPGLHPDDYDAPESGWPSTLKKFAAEAWRRSGIGELADEELYPCDSQWASLYDRMAIHTDEETERRLELAALSRKNHNA